MAFSASDCYRLKLLRVLETAGQAVLTYTLQCGTAGKSPTDNLDKYLKNLPHDSSANFNNLSNKEKKKHFNNTDMKQIISDMSCSTFDISLLVKAISVACESVAWIHDSKWKHTASNEIESLVTKIKDARNVVVHETLSMTEQRFMAELVNLGDLFVAALEATKVKYSRDQAECEGKKRDVMKLIDEIRQENLSKQEILQRSAAQLLPLFRLEVDEELKQKHIGSKYLSPLRFLTGHENRRVDVDDIFSKIIINEEKKATKTVHCLNLITLTQDGRSPSSPHVMMVEGDAGSGKTTLLTFLLAEWLKEETHRRMEGFHHFDLLFWIVCREESSPTLEILVERVLQDAYVKYRNLLLPLIKKCRVLFLIDGLDEQTDFSRGLIRDIMSQGKDCPTFTVICTSRPEALTTMKASIPESFQISHTRIVGIAVEERTEFVVRHLHHLSDGVPVDTARLRQVMQLTGYKELFRLPLNLLFLSYLYMVEPQKLTTRVTQTELYQDIHGWCVEKLYHRLARRQQEVARIFLKRRILKTLTVFYEVALRGLLHGNIYLSDEDLSRLIASCSLERLPEEEVLSAFYSLRREVVRGAATEMYCAPHKGLQEFFASHHILGRLDQYSPGDIRRVLQNLTPGRNLQLQSLRNLFSQLLGLLSHQDEPMVTAMEETVDLIHESGVKDTDEWLSVLADTEAHPCTMTRVAHHIKRNHDAGYYDDTTKVRDGTVYVAAALLPLIPRKKVYIVLEMEPAGMNALVPALANHTVVGLQLWHHYQHHHPAPASANLLQQLPRSHLTRFIGHLNAEHLSLLPRSLGMLYLLVAGDSHARSILPALEHVCQAFPNLQWLHVHVPVSAVTPCCLSPLPRLPLFLYLSGVGDNEVEVVCRIAAAMSPRDEEYFAFMFPDASLVATGYQRLLEGLVRLGVRLRLGVWVPDNTINKDEESQLNTLAQSLLRCSFSRASQPFLWRGH